MGISIAGIVQVVIGVILLFVPGAQAIGVGLIVGGLAAIGAGLLAPEASEPDDSSQSPVYGFNQFKNPWKASAVIPVIYSAVGMRTAPVWIQAWVTPKGGDEDEDSAKTRSLTGQGISGVMAVCEGPIVGMSNEQFDGENVFDYFTDVPLARSNGGRTYKIEATRIDLHSVRVYVDGELAGWEEEEDWTVVGFGDGSTTVFASQLANVANIVYERGIRFYSRNPNRQGEDRSDFEVSANRSALDEMVPVAWIDEGGTLIVNTQIPMARGEALWAVFTSRYLNGGIRSMEKNNKSGVTVTFYEASKPTSGQEVTADYRRKMFRGIRWDWRSGSFYDLPFRDAFDIRNTYGVNEEIVQAYETQYETTDAVDNTILIISSNEQGFRVLHPRDGGTSQRAAYAQFTIEMKLQTATGSHYYDDWVRIPDPAGAFNKNPYDKSGHKKTGNEFEVTAESEAQVVWGFNIRLLLQRFVEKHPNDTDAKKRLSNFTRNKYVYRVRRTSAKQNNSDTFYDDIYLLQAKDIIDEFLSRPGVAKIKWEAVGSKRLNGRPPTVTVDVQGISTVRRYDNASSRWVEDEQAQGNRVWAMIDLITNPNYGAGAHYSIDTDFDPANALECANWQEEEVAESKDVDTLEARCQFDAVLDQRKTLLDWLKAMALSGRLFVYQSGTQWRFVKDDAVTLVDSNGDDLVDVIYDSTIAGRTQQKSAKLGHAALLNRPTTLLVEYLRRDDDFLQRYIQVTLQDSHNEVTRTHRATAFGITRRSEANRYALFLFNQMREPGLSLGVAVSPQALTYELGSVKRFVSDRIGVDAYFRVFEFSTDGDTFFVQLDLRQYVPSVYEQNYSAFRIIESGFKLARFSTGIAKTITQTQGSTPTTAGRTSATNTNLTAKRRSGTRLRRLRVSARRTG